jgi:hypothetical protein
MIPKSGYRFRKTSSSTNKPERDADAKKRHPGRPEQIHRRQRRGGVPPVINQFENAILFKLRSLELDGTRLGAGKHEHQ